MGWGSYKRTEEPPLKEGNYRVAITAVDHAVSQSSGKNMLVIHMKTDTKHTGIRAYIVDNDYWNINLTKFFDCFPEIPEGNLNTLEWVGALGAIRIGINDRGYPEFKWFIKAQQAEKLSIPEWQGIKPERNVIQNGLTGIVEEVDEKDLPF